MFENIHEGHLGMEKCKRRARVSLYWPGMNAVITDMTKSCSKCIQYRNQQANKPLQPHEIPIRARLGVNSILSIPINSISSIPIPHQIYQFQFNSKFINSHSVFSRLFYCLILFTMSRYSEYLLGIHTPSSLYSTQHCNRRNISEIKN